MLELLALITILSALAADVAPTKKPKKIVYDGVFQGQIFWSGEVSLLDGVVEEIHTYAEAEAGDFHHSLYFSPRALQRMQEDKTAFFWVNQDDGQIYTAWRVALPSRLMGRLREQIAVVPRSELVRLKN